VAQVAPKSGVTTPTYAVKPPLVPLARPTLALKGQVTKSLHRPPVPLVTLRPACLLLSVAALLSAGQQARPSDSDEAFGPAPILPAPAPPAPAINEEKIFGVIPNYQTVNDPNAAVTPLTARQKFTLFFKSTLDPFNMAGAAVGSAFSQRGNQTPKYGNGAGALGMRFGAALADFGTQSFFSSALLATLLHQDPRYFRKGPGAGMPARVLYSVSRLTITRGDSGRQEFNTSSVAGMALGIATSNLYYPAESIRGSVMAGRLYTSLTGGIVGNLMSEFWPDLQKKFLHRKKR
jgi:hypothetical protein